MFHRPATLDEALSLKAHLGAQARFIAGGTDLVVMMKKGRYQPEEIIDLSLLPQLAETHWNGDRAFIGSGRSLRSLEAWDVDVLAQAARTVGGPQIRNRGTIGGNVGTASPAGDVSVALLALDATVELLSERGMRSLPLRDFFLGVGKTAIAPDELIMGLTFDRPAKSAFYKVGKRNSVAISVVCMGVAIAHDRQVRIAVGSVAPTPLRLLQTESFLNQAGINAETIEKAAEMASQEVRPITDHRASREYRQAIAGTLVNRLLTQLTAQGGAS